MIQGFLLLLACVPPTPSVCGTNSWSFSTGRSFRAGTALKIAAPKVFSLEIEALALRPPVHGVDPIKNAVLGLIEDTHSICYIFLVLSKLLEGIQCTAVFIFSSGLKINIHGDF